MHDLSFPAAKPALAVILGTSVVLYLSLPSHDTAGMANEFWHKWLIALFAEVRASPLTGAMVHLLGVATVGFHIQTVT